MYLRLTDINGKHLLVVTDKVISVTPASGGCTIETLGSKTYRVTNAFEEVILCLEKLCST